MAETKYGGTVTNVNRKSSRWWEQLQQNYEIQSMCGHVGQPTNYSLMNEVVRTVPSVGWLSFVGWAAYPCDKWAQYRLHSAIQAHMTRNSSHKMRNWSHITTQYISCCCRSFSCWSDALQVDLRFCNFKSDQEYIWQDCSSSKLNMHQLITKVRFLPNFLPVRFETTEPEAFLGTVDNSRKHRNHKKHDFCQMLWFYVFTTIFCFNQHNLKFVVWT